MLLDGHHLDGVVTVFFHPWQHVLPEFVVAAHFLFLGRHPYMCFIDQQWRFVWLEVVVFEAIAIRWFPYLCTEERGHLILYHPFSPCRNPLSRTTGPGDLQFIKITVADPFSGYFHLPNATISLFQAVGFHPLPLVESTYQEDFSGVGCPLTEHPALLRAVQPEPEVTGGKVGEGDLTALGEIGQTFQVIGVAPFNCLFVGGQPRIILDDIQHDGLLFF